MAYINKQASADAPSICYAISKYVFPNSRLKAFPCQLKHLYLLYKSEMPNDLHNSTFIALEFSKQFGAHLILASAAFATVALTAAIVS